MKPKARKVLSEGFADEKLYQGIFENMMHGFIHCKVLYNKQHEAVDYVYLDVNKAYESYTGLSNVLGKRISEFIPGLREADPELFKTIGRVSTSGNAEKFETFVEALNRWYSVSMYCPKKGYFVALVDNITEAKTAERKLSESETRFKALIEKNSDAIVLLDPGLNIIYESPSTERITGFANQERHLNSYRNAHPDDVARVMEVHSEAAQKPGVPAPLQCRILHKGGHYIWIEGFVTNLVSEPSVEAILVNYHDVTERRRLEEQHKLLALIVDSSDDAIISKNLDGTITSWNHGAERLFGYTTDEIIGRNVSILIPPDRLNEEPQIIERIARGEFVDHYETVRVRKDGRVVYISITVSPIYDKSGKIIGASKIARDISERLAAKEELAASEKRFRALIENSTDAIVLNDENTNIIYQSPSVERILGYTIQERMGKQVLDYVHKNDMDKFIRLYNDLKGSPGIPLAFQYRFRRKAGDYVWLEGVVTNQLKNASVRAFVANYRDVTARKEAEEALELTLSRFKQAQEVAHLGHWEVDFTTQVATWSDETFRIFGLQPNEVNPSQQLFLAHVHAEDLEIVEKELALSWKAFTPFSFYHRIVSNMGDTKVLLSVGRYEFDESNDPRRLYGISLDVTELTEKGKKLEEVNKDLETFIYKSSHDLRSPIASILGLISVAKVEVSEPKALNYLDMIEEVVKRQNKMLLNLIQVVSIRDRRLIIEPFRIGPLVDEVLESLKSMENFSRVRFNVRQLTDKPIIADRDLVLILLSHIVENAILYSGGMEPEVTVDVSLDEKGNHLIEVGDNGIGIEEEILDKVFDMFYRGAILSRGSGLGLYLSRTAVEKMGGTIRVSSVEHEGTRFVVMLPARFQAKVVASKLEPVQ